MPYKITHEHGRWQLRKKLTGKVVSEHDSKEKAEAAERAIYAHENRRVRFK